MKNEQLNKILNSNAKEICSTIKYEDLAEVVKYACELLDKKYEPQHVFKAEEWGIKADVPVTYAKYNEVDDTYDIIASDYGIDPEFGGANDDDTLFEYIESRLDTRINALPKYPQPDEGRDCLYHEPDEFADVELSAKNIYNLTRRYISDGCCDDFDNGDWGSEGYADKMTPFGTTLELGNRKFCVVAWFYDKQIEEKAYIDGAVADFGNLNWDEPDRIIVDEVHSSNYADSWDD